MPLSPAKSRHEGNWLHFTIPFGGALPLGRLMALLRQTILQGKQSFLSALLPVLDLAKAANCLQKWQVRVIGRKASVFVPASEKAM